MKSNTKQGTVTRISITLLIIVVSLISIFPLLWMLMVSLKSGRDIIDPSIWIFKPTLDNFKEAIQYRNILGYLRNSFIVVIITTVISIFIGGLAAYGFARFDFKRRENTAFWILSLRMLPPMAIVIPFFIMAQLLNVLDTHIVLIISYMLFNIPFAIWMLRGFFEEVPEEIEEAALIDGCSRFQVFTKILLPLTTPGLIATAIFCIIFSWNEFVFALFLTSTSSTTLPTTVNLFLSITGTEWGEMAAVGIITVLPVLIFAMLVQKYLIRGLTFGGVK